MSDNDNRPLSSWAKVPTHFSREEAKEWKGWLDDDRGTDINKGRFTCSGPVSYGAPPEDIDELIERMIARGVLARD